MIADHHITVDGLQKMKNKRVEQAGIQNFVFLDLRRMFAEDLWNMGVDESSISDLMGIETMQQVRKYDHR